MSCCYRSLSLTSTEDRLVLEGVDFFEFDLATGRLLRRYPALSNEYPRWTFHGVAVSPRLAADLGIAPGFYGFPECPRTDFGSQCGVPTRPFPGYPDMPGVVPLTDYSLVLRRSFEPADNSLDVAGVFPIDALPQYTRRYLAVDTRRRGLWSWTEFTPNPGVSGRFQRLGFIGIAAGALASETTHALWNWNGPSSASNSKYAHAFGYMAADDSAYLSFIDTESDRYSFVRKPVDLSDEDVVEGAPSEERLQQNDAVTGVLGDLPTTYVQVVPAIGQGPGAHSTYWQSDLYLFNPSANAMTISIRRVARPTERVEYVLPAHASKKVAGVLRALGGGPVEDGGDGVITDGLVIESTFEWSRQLSVYSRTYTAGSTGTYGQAVPAVPSAIGYATHSSDFTYPIDLDSMVSTLILDKRDPGRFRHNFGVVNDGDQPINVRLRFDFGSTANLPPDSPYERAIAVPSHSVANVNLETLFPGDVFSTRPPRLWLAAERPAPVWLSIVDNNTGDATFVPFSLFALRGSDTSSIAIPAVAATRGANETTWQTDLYGLFLPVDSGEDPQQPVVSFFPAEGADCPSSVGRLRGAGTPGTWPDYYDSVFANVVAQAGCIRDVRGAIELRSASWMTGFSRTYTTNPDGGTLGEMLPFYPAGGWPEQNFAGIDLRPGFRVNIGLYNGLRYDVDNRLDLYARDGTMIASATISLAAHKSTQLPLTSLFGALPEGLYGLSVVPTAADGVGRSWAYVSTVDNSTGDPTNWW